MVRRGGVVDHYYDPEEDGVKWWKEKGWPWVRDKLWPFLKKHWKAIAVVAGAVIGYKIVEGIIRNAELGRVDRPDQFRKIDEDHIAVKNTAGAWETVDLTTIKTDRPVKADNVRAAMLVPGGPARVEVIR